MSIAQSVTAQGDIKITFRNLAVGEAQELLECRARQLQLTAPADPAADHADPAEQAAAEDAPPQAPAQQSFEPLAGEWASQTFSVETYQDFVLSDERKTFVTMRVMLDFLAEHVEEWVTLRDVSGGDEDLLNALKSMLTKASTQLEQAGLDWPWRAYYSRTAEDPSGGVKKYRITAVNAENWKQARGLA